MLIEKAASATFFKVPSHAMEHARRLTAGVIPAATGNLAYPHQLVSNDKQHRELPMMAIAPGVKTGGQ